MFLLYRNPVPKIIYTTKVIFASVAYILLQFDETQEGQDKLLAHAREYTMNIDMARSSNSTS